MEERIIKDINNLLAQLFQKMHEAGYEWDAEKKELKEIEQKPDDDIECKYNPCYNMSFEEAQEYISNRGFDIPWTDCDVFVDFRYVTQTVANILRWADDNPRQKSSWSEEDENRFRNLIYLVEHSDEGSGTKRGFVKFINRLKSLRPQPRWKPSDEQMNALEAMLTVSPQSPAMTSALIELYEDLKKLKG